MACTAVRLYFLTRLGPVYLLDYRLYRLHTAGLPYELRKWQACEDEMNSFVEMVLQIDPDLESDPDTDSVPEQAIGLTESNLDAAVLVEDSQEVVDRMLGTDYSIDLAEDLQDVVRRIPGTAHHCKMVDLDPDLAEDFACMIVVTVWHHREAVDLSGVARRFGTGFEVLDLLAVADIQVAGFVVQ